MGNWVHLWMGGSDGRKKGVSIVCDGSGRLDQVVEWLCLQQL